MEEPSSRKSSSNEPIDFDEKTDNPTWERSNGNNDINTNTRKLNHSNNNNIKQWVSPLQRKLAQEPRTT